VTEGICALGGRRAPHVAYLRTEIAKKYSQSKTGATASEQGPRVGKDPVFFASDYAEEYRTAKDLAAPGFQGPKTEMVEANLRLVISIAK